MAVQIDRKKIDHLVGLIDTWREVDARRPTDDGWQQSVRKLIAIQAMLEDLSCLLRGEPVEHTEQMDEYLADNPYYLQ